MPPIAPLIATDDALQAAGDCPELPLAKGTCKTAHAMFSLKLHRQ